MKKSEKIDFRKWSCVDSFSQFLDFEQEFGLGLFENVS